MEVGEMLAPVEQARQAFDISLRPTVARYILKGSREKYNARLAELAKDHSDLGDERRANFQESDLARLVRDSVDRLSASESENREEVVLNLTRNDVKIIRVNCKPTIDAADIRLNRAMTEEFEGAIFQARRKAAKGVVAKTKVILGF